MKVIVGSLEENAIEAKMQRDLTLGIPSNQESRLMPIFDVIEERDSSSGKLIRLNLVMPLASFGNVRSLRDKLKSEQDVQLKISKQIDCTRSFNWNLANALSKLLSFGY